MQVSLILLFLCQQAIDPTRPAQAAEMLARARDASQAATSHKATAETKRQFAERFNRLVTALKDFQDAYSENRGEVWPSKQAARLDTAMRELSDSPGWRKP